MFPETSQSPQCILPPVIYEVPETSLLPPSPPSPFPRSFTVFYTRLFLSFCPFFIVLPAAPGFRLLVRFLVERLHPLLSRISSVRRSVARSLYSVAHSTSSVCSTKEFGSFNDSPTSKRGRLTARA